MYLMAHQRERPSTFLQTQTSRADEEDHQHNIEAGAVIIEPTLGIKVNIPI